MGGLVSRIGCAEYEVLNLFSLGVHGRICLAKERPNKSTVFGKHFSEESGVDNGSFLSSRKRRRTDTFLCGIPEERVTKSNKYFEKRKASPTPVIIIFASVFRRKFREGLGKIKQYGVCLMSNLSNCM